MLEKENSFLPPPSDQQVPPSTPSLSMRAQVQCSPGGAGGEVGVLRAWWRTVYGHQLLCGQVQERVRVQPKLNSQSDDLSSRPAQLSSQALAPPKCGRGPGCTGSHMPTPPYPASLLPETGLNPCGELRWPLSSSAPTQEALCTAVPAGPGGTTEAQSLSPASDLALPLTPAPWGGGGGGRSDKAPGLFGGWYGKTCWGTYQQGTPACIPEGY